MPAGLPCPQLLLLFTPSCGIVSNPYFPMTRHPPVTGRERSLPRPQVAALPSPAPCSVTSCVHNFPTQLQMPIWGCEIFHGLLLGYSSYFPEHRHSAQLDQALSVVVSSPHPVFCATITFRRTLLTSFNRPTVKEGSTWRG